MSALEKFILGTIGALALANWLDPEPEVDAEEIGALHAYRFTPVYRELPSADSPGKTNIRFSERKSGTYLIKENDEVVYVGQSQSDLYHTIMHHFSQWNDSRQPDRITYKNSLKRNRYTVRIIFASPTKALKLEEALIRKYRPRDNAGKLFLMEPTPRQEAAQDAILEEYEQVKYEYPPDWD